MIECEHSRCQAAIDALGEEVAMRDMEIINLMEHYREKMLNLSHRHWTLQRELRVAQSKLSKCKNCVDYALILTLHLGARCGRWSPLIGVAILRICLAWVV
jgi:hypothetical protein